MDSDAGQALAVMQASTTLLNSDAEIPSSNIEKASTEATHKDHVKSYKDVIDLVH